MNGPPEPAMRTGRREPSAPVITSSGTYGRLPPPPRPVLPRAQRPWASARAAVVWLSLIGCALSAAVWLLVISATQATSPDVALPVLERGIGVITEIDELLSQHAGEFAEASGDEVELPGFLVPNVALTTAEAQGGDAERMRAALLSRSAQLIYEGGVATLHQSDAAAIETPLFSTQGGAKQVMTLLSADNHQRLADTQRPVAMLMIGFGVVGVLFGNGVQRFSGLGLAMLGAAAIAFSATLVLKLALAVIGSDGSRVATEFAQLAGAVVWTPAENAKIFGVAGLAILLPAWLFGWLFSRSTVGDAPPASVIDQPRGMR